MGDNILVQDLQQGLQYQFQPVKQFTKQEFNQNTFNDQSIQPQLIGSLYQKLYNSNEKLCQRSTRAFTEHQNYEEQTQKSHTMQKFDDFLKYSQYGSGFHSSFPQNVPKNTVKKSFQMRSTGNYYFQGQDRFDNQNKYQMLNHPNILAVRHKIHDNKHNSNQNAFNRNSDNGLNIEFQGLKLSKGKIKQPFIQKFKQESTIFQNDSNFNIFSPDKNDKLIRKSNQQKNVDRKNYLNYQDKRNKNYNIITFSKE
ncbi:hypothetical protein PPERSA_00423 [Pseudocohnilembus persalinus]|uniref:Uncharacterized protein n=1 Tax=Pseudocohnilembus persalinus TaxID=266149 RepID=A0A0V0Q9A6_PSEPJ|nr:hypothetical protein PPERSA_00423 [Pseudocohnilembus persalinus]|eukprot:KRW98834.1 hypothetical protein PPERSA_00423 [Pseudocohnilembus persalinus]